MKLFSWILSFSEEIYLIPVSMLASKLYFFVGIFLFFLRELGPNIREGFSWEGVLLSIEEAIVCINELLLLIMGKLAKLSTFSSSSYIFSRLGSLVSRFDKSYYCERKAESIFLSVRDSIIIELLLLILLLILLLFSSSSNY